MGLRDRNRLKEYKCFFITTTCNNWHKLLKDDRYYSILYNSMKFVNKKYSASIIAYVFMPNHIHFILYFNDENQLSEYMRDLKKFTSGEIRRLLEKDGEFDLLNKIRYNGKTQKFKVWMDRFDDVIIDNEEILINKLKYIHRNPIRRNLVLLQEQYKHSSAGFYYIKKEPLMDILHCNEII